MTQYGEKGVAGSGLMNIQIEDRIKEAEGMVLETKSCYRQAVRHLKGLQRMQKQQEFERNIEKTLIMPNALIGSIYYGKRLSLVSEKVWHYALGILEDSDGDTIPQEALELISPSLKQKKFRDAKIEELRNCVIILPGGLYTKLFSYIEYRDRELVFIFELPILLMVLTCTRAAQAGASSY